MKAICTDNVVAKSCDILDVGSNAYFPSPFPGAEQVADRVAYWRGAQEVA